MVLPGDLPSFLRDNPWVAILSRRGEDETLEAEEASRKRLILCPRCRKYGILTSKTKRKGGRIYTYYYCKHGENECYLGPSLSPIIQMSPEPATRVQIPAAAPTIHKNREKC